MVHKSAPKGHHTGICTCETTTLRGTFDRNLDQVATSRKDQATLVERTVKAAERSLATQGYANPIDVFLRIGWLDPNIFEDWRQGRLDWPHGVIQVKPARSSEAVTLLRSWATQRGLVASETEYVARTPQRQTLRFSQSGNAALEALYRTHWISGDPPKKKRERLVENANRAPNLVVIQPVNREWKYHCCGRTGALLVMESAGPACLRCAGRGDIEFLPAGDALLMRRVKAKTPNRPSSCVSANGAVAMNDKASWSSRRPCNRCSAI